MSTPLRIVVESKLSHPADQLRLRSFPENYHCTPTTDEFDTKAIHITGYHVAEAVFYLRLVAGPNSVFSSWVTQPNEMPFSPSSIDLNRVCVSSAYQGCRIAEFAATFSFAIAHSHGFHVAIGTVEAGTRMENFMERLGMSRIGLPVQEHEPGGHSLSVQPYGIDLLTHTSALHDRLNRLTLQLAREDIVVDLPLAVAG